MSPGPHSLEGPGGLGSCRAWRGGALGGAGGRGAASRAGAPAASVVTQAGALAGSGGLSLSPAGLSPFRKHHECHGLLSGGLHTGSGRGPHGDSQAESMTRV